jgi:hypothetical protein
MAMMESAVMLSGVTSREFIPGVLARLVDGADERAISVGISALFILSGLRHMARGTNLSLPGIQMTVAAQHSYSVATPRAVKRFEQVPEESLTRPGLAFGESTHR